MIITGTYDLRVVSLSFLVAVMASYTAIDIAGRVTASRGRTRALWLAGGSVAMGLGIWSMHFTAMLGFHLPMPMPYDVPTVVLSMLVAVAASGFALILVCGRTLNLPRLLVGGLLMGVAIAAMHYIGMAGMRVDATIRYDTGLVALSILVAIGASLAALRLAFSFRRGTGAAQIRLMIGSAVLMGAAISGMHYTGMAATEFVATDHPIAGSSLHADTSWLGAAAVASGAFIVLGFTLLTALVDRRMAAQSAEAVALRRSEERLRESEARHRAVVDTASEGIVTMDEEGIIESFNRGAEAIFGYSAADAIGLSAVLLVPERFQSTHLEGIRRCVDTSRELGTRRTVELTGRRRDGSEFPLELSVAEVREATRVFFTTIIRDVTERREAEDRLEHQAHHDPLTGLPNRALLLDRLEQARRDAARDHGSVAVLMLDLDRFKAVNDRLGHAAGDRFLIETSARLGASLRPGDSLARLGGDEFIALLPEADVAEAASVAQRLLAALAAPVVINGHELVGEASIGITVAGSRQVDGEAVLREADVAMYAAKAAGRGRWAVFDAAMDAAVARRLDRDSALRRAVARGEFVLQYQPQIELATGRVAGAEALVRWNHPKLGLLPPGEFIGLAKETGLIVPLGRWILHEACFQARAWPNRYPDAPLLICINISMHQLEKTGLVADISEALTATGLDPCRLELELTESETMHDPPEVERILRELRTLGVKLAIDDFGTGFASLTRLRQQGFDRLKIDRSFVAGLGRDRHSLAIVRAVTILAHDLGMSVTAEGVETDEQVALLREVGVDHVQGYYFARPQSEVAIVERLELGSEFLDEVGPVDVGGSSATHA